MSETDSFDDVAPPPTPTKSSIQVSDPESVSQNQLKKIYKLMSQSFSREVSSVSDVQSVIKAFVNKYIKTRDQLKEQKELNEQLNDQLQQSIDQTQIDEADKEQLATNQEELTKKLRQYKKQVLSLRQQVSDQEAATVEAQTQIREVQLKLEESEREKQKLTEELTKLQVQLSKETPQKPVKTESERVEETAKLFEDMLAAQGEEINDLVQQRETLIQNLRSLDAAVREAEAQIQKEQNEKQEIIKSQSDISKRNEELSDALPILAQEVEQLIPHDLRSTLPQNGPDPANFIKAVVEELVALRAAPHEEEEEDKEEVVAKAKYVELITRLEDCLRYIQNIAKAGDKATDACPLGVDSEVRNTLLTQCARIGHFVDENLLEVGIENLPQHVSIFEADSFETAESQLKEFLNFVTEEQLKESPLRELFALFTAVCEVNKMVMNYADKIKAQQQQPQQQVNVSSEMIRNLQRDNFDLAQWKAVNQERIEAATAALQKLTCDDGETALDVMAQQLADKYEEAQKENETLKENITKIEAEKKELEETTQASLMEAEEKVQTREISFQEEEKQHQDMSQQFEAKVSKLSSANESLKQRLQQTTENYEATIREKSAKLKKAVQAQSETKKMLDAIQERTDAVIQENQELHQINAEMEETITTQKEQLEQFAINEKKLRDSRENLKKRIATAEAANKTTLADIKQRNDDIQQKYLDTVNDLTNELNNYKQQVETLKEQEEASANERADLAQQITNLRVSERALNLKLKTAQERQQLEKSANEARNNTYMLSLKAQAQRQIDEVNAQLAQIRASINKILEQTFGETPDENATFNELFTRIDRRLQMFTADKKVLADAIKLRGELKLQPSASLSDAYASETQARQNAEKKAERSHNERCIIEKELNNLKRATEKMAADAKQTKDWENWGRSLYKQVNEGSTDIPSSELRFKLTEDVLAAVKDRTTIKRLDSLREQKKILSNPAINEKAPADKELAIRSIYNILVFAQRIQGEGAQLVPLSPRKGSF